MLNVKEIGNHAGSFYEKINFPDTATPQHEQFVDTSKSYEPITPTSDPIRS